MSGLKAGLLAGAAVLTLASCASAQTDAGPPRIPGHAQTEAAARGEVNKAIVVLGAGDAPARIVATAGLDGLEVYDLSGRKLSAASAGEAGSLDVRYGFSIDGRAMPLIVSTDTTNNSLRFFTLEADALREVGARAVPLGFAVEGVCLFRNIADGALYVIAVGDGGEFDQHMVFADTNGQVDARQARRLGLPSPSEHCVADDQDGQVYVSEQTVGVWRFVGDPEADAEPTLIDAPRLGHITGEVGGVALYDGGAGARYLIASDASSGRLFVYDRGNHDAWLSGASLVTSTGAAVEEPGGLFASAMAGVLLAANEDAEEGANYSIVRMTDMAAALGLRTGNPHDPRVVPPSLHMTAAATVETVPVVSAGDAADDPAIWANPADPSASLVVATDKKSGLYVYDMQGRVLQHLPDGKMNNVDLRDGFMLGGRPIVLVTASNRTDKSISIYRLDTDQRQLVEIADGLQPTGQGDPYGLCMYRSTRSGKTFVFINDSNGEKRQWELIDAGNGRVRTERVRDFAFSSQAEGCVADDEAGVLYVNEEDVGLWRLDAEPDGGSAMTALDRVEDNPAIKDDVEGIGLYDLGGGRGYLIVSSQGNNSYAVYRREGDQAYLGSFSVIADGQNGVDGISETDGLDVSSANLGPGFEHGAMIAQDGRNVLPSELQNYKYVPWQRIAEVLGLEMR